MRSKWKVLPLVCTLGAIVLGAGCSGINATHSVSPATFLLPGLLKADPPPEQPERTLPALEPGIEVAWF